MYKLKFAVNKRLFTIVGTKIYSKYIKVNSYFGCKFVIFNKFTVKKFFVVSDFESQKSEQRNNQQEKVHGYRRAYNRNINK